MSADTLGVIAIITVVVVIAVIAYIYEIKRTEALSMIAKDLGFEFDKSGRLTTRSLITSFPLYKRGRSRKVLNEIWGRDGDAEVSIFGYFYTVGSGKNSTTYRQTIVAISNHQLNTPAFELRPEHTFHKIGQVLGYQDIDFADYPDFSDKFLLRGPNEQAIRDYFSAELIEYFEDKPKIYVEAQGNTMIFYNLGKRCKPEEIQPLYDKAKDIYYRLAAAS